MAPFGHVAFLLWIGLLLLSPGVQANVSCTDQEIPAGCNASIVCNFTQDINAGRWDIGINRFPINTTTDDISSRKSVLSCNWGTGNNPQCFLSPDFTSYEISGNVAVVRVASVTKELEGIYRCQPINQDIQITNCKLNVKPAGKCEHERSLVPTTPSPARSPQETESANWHVVAIAVIVLFIIAIAFPLAVFFAHCKHGKIGQLPKRLRELFSFDDNRGSEAESQQFVDQSTPLEEQNAEPTEIEELRAYKITLTVDNKKLTGEKNMLTDKNKKLTEANTQLTKTKTKLEADIKMLENNESRLKTKSQKDKEQIASLKKTIEQTQIDLGGLDGILKTNESTLEQQQKEIETLKNDKSALTNELEEFKSLCTKLNGNYQNLQAERDKCTCKRNPEAQH